ncbi:D-alanine-D-alanine ligase [Lewinella marina]|uniref:D-alanine--D-alanine ligase n=1 Tax=Neolewinella marina TaxID=438751 RepID=A0A2G0CDD6_9BACT|nr:PASTA domain-containing protein [Neolewinella marina]NJB86863.1 D-alanine-D-alanine ligase [Neolewinella marina]PHK97937.1 D-alanine--D-alanine ligase [Neolewinella marina]
MSIRVGIFFGGPSREREISFAGGRTVYDNLDKSLFEPVPIFVDSFRRWYLLDWQYLYRGSIRDFFPPVALAPESRHAFQVYQESLGPLDELALEDMGRHIGRRLRREELPELIDIAFLALHGEYGEDGVLQRELEYAGVPYTGSGVEASEVGMDKALQKELMAKAGYPSPPILVIEQESLPTADIEELFHRSVERIGWPMVVRPARQGSSIGVSILKEEAGLAGFERAVNAAFFREPLLLADYADRSPADRIEYVRRVSDLRDGIAFPLDAQRGDHRLTIYTPDDLFDYLEAAVADDGHPLVVLEGHQSEERVIIEGFIDGKEFSTIVLRQPDGGVVALPPTEIVKFQGELFDYRSKYLPGRSRKVTPINLPAEAIQRIRRETERLFTELGFAVYARIDGFYTADGTIYLNDPNTTSGMMPSSFFFHQAAEIGLSPSQFLTYIIRTSLQERDHTELMDRLDAELDALAASAGAKERVAVMLGGTSFERHISVESGRNVYEKLSSSERFRPLPLFLTAPLAPGQEGEDFVLYQLPVNLLLKDNADDIRDKLIKPAEHPVIDEIRRSCRAITARYADPDVVFAPRHVPLEQLPEVADLVFIALHGRPGEDGQVQRKLERLGLPYNGSGPDSSSITIDKYETLQVLKQGGLPVTQQWLGRREDFLLNTRAFYNRVEDRFTYPLIAKPVDDGCSSAVLLLRNREQLEAYCELTFRPGSAQEAAARRTLKLGEKEEWPLGKSTILFEVAITAAGAEKFLEITGGMLTHFAPDGRIRYEVFEPSEALAGGEILSLEEKFLAGEGQNLTPARLATKSYGYDYVADQVKGDLERAARLLGVTGYCRIDAFVRIFPDGRAETVVIEVNSLPGITPATAIFHQAAIAGYQPYQFIAAILDFAKERVRRGGVVPTVAAPEPPASRPDPAPAAAPPPMTEETPEKSSFLGPLLKNVVAALIFLGILFLLLKTGLNWYTNHGESMAIPTFEGMLIDEARQLAESNDLKIDVTVGAFDPEQPAGLVVQQQPRIGSRVKNNRTVYLTILSDEAPDVELPSLVGNYDYNQYIRLLKVKNINYRVRERQFDARQEDGTILYLYYDGKKITDEDLREGVKVPMGSTVEFVITERKGDDVTVGDYRCQTFGTGEFAITGSQLLVGRIVGDVADRNEAWIVRTDPPAGTTVEAGSRVDVFLSDDLPEECP